MKLVVCSTAIERTVASYKNGGQVMHNVDNSKYNNVCWFSSPRSCIAIQNMFINMILFQFLVSPFNLYIHICKRSQLSLSLSHKHIWRQLHTQTQTQTHRHTQTQTHTHTRTPKDFNSHHSIQCHHHHTITTHTQHQRHQHRPI